jgi:thioredoxin-like negative regulator of GroEL
MFERVLLLIGVILASVAAYQLFARLHLFILCRSRSAKDLTRKQNRPALLYFSADDCASCYLQQTPAIERLRSELGEQFDLVQIDALQQRQLATQFRVWTVPTTIVLNSHGEVRYVNPGAMPAIRLREQILSVE